MNWQDIEISANNKFFNYKGEKVFGKTFLNVLKFHSPGLAAVQDESGCYHIDNLGNELYKERYDRTFGYYCNRAAVVKGTKCFHLTEEGNKAYSTSFLWTGNYQENLCSVRNIDNKYFHIDLNGVKIYSSAFIYTGDFKDAIACVRTANGFYKHITKDGNFLNEKEFSDLGIFHKNYAIAKDKFGWHHIDKSGKELYSNRYLMIEPFYNGFSVVETFEGKKLIIDEKGNKILEL